MKEVLSEKNVTFAYVDITSGIGPLKQFLKIRDTAEVFADVRETHRVGVPALWVDDGYHLVDGPEHAARLVDELGLAEETGGEG